MKVRAWRTENAPPDDRVFISIQVLGGGGGIAWTPPWVLAIEDAQDILGDAVYQIPAEPIYITLTMALERQFRAVEATKEIESERTD